MDASHCKDGKAWRGSRRLGPDSGHRSAANHDSANLPTESSAHARSRNAASALLPRPQTACVALAIATPALILLFIFAGADTAVRSLETWKLRHRLSGPVVTPAAHRAANDAPAKPAPFPGVLTWHNDNFRTGQNLQETVLTPRNVASKQFGRTFCYPVDGAVYAQPLYLPDVAVPGKARRDILFVATENDSVYAFDADAGRAEPLWRVRFLAPERSIIAVPAADWDCLDIRPQYGITSTPVLDTAAGALYVVALTKESGAYFYKLHALDLATGAEKPASPVTISASSPGARFEASQQLQRPALLLSRGTIYIGFGSHCDQKPYRGWLLAYDAGTLAQAGALNITPAGEKGSLWMAGAGPAADQDGHIFVATSNGTFNADLNGRDYSQSLLHIRPDLSVQDYFTPFNHAALSAADLDLGSSGVVLLPEQPGPHAHLLVSGGKEGRVYLADRDNLGHFHADGDQVFQAVPNGFPAGLFTTAAYWNHRVYFAAAEDVLQEFRLGDSGIALPAESRDSEILQYPGATPSISASGQAGAIVWIVNPQRSGPVLRALDALNVSHKLFTARIAGSRPVKFAPVTIANGRVYVPTEDSVVVFGLYPRPTR